MTQHESLKNVEKFKTNFSYIAVLNFDPNISVIFYNWKITEEPFARKIMKQKKNNKAFNPKLKKPELYQKYIIILCKNAMDNKKSILLPRKSYSLL